jgi:hypothetical protein
MMPALVRELAAGGSVAVTRLFQFNFASGTKRYWDGLGPITIAGNVWEGAADLISVSGLEWAQGLAASQVTFTLAGTTPELIEAAINGDIEAKQRPCSVYLQFLNAAYDPLDDIIPIWAGRMDRPIFRGTVTSQQISLQAESLFVERIRAPWGLLTDTDQQARFPGDRGLEFMPSLINKTEDWLRG